MLVNDTHRFCLGLKVDANLAIAVTAVEAASTRAIKLTIQMVSTQLIFVNEENPYRTLDSTIFRVFRDYLTLMNLESKLVSRTMIH